MEENPSQNQAVVLQENPDLERTHAFSSSFRERVCAFAMYAAAYLYVYSYFSIDGLFYEWGWKWRILLTVFALVFVLMTEYLHWTTKRLPESWIWLGCAAAVILSLFVRVHPDQEPVWNEGQTVLFLHIFAVWWAISRTDRLAGGESGSLLPLDALNGFVLVPFGNFFLRIRCVFSAFRQKPKREGRGRTVAAVIIAAIAGLALLILSARQLAGADGAFQGLLDRLRLGLNLRIDGDVVGRVLLSLPVGAYVFGLIAGLGRQDRERVLERGTLAKQMLARLRQVPSAVWLAVLGVFSAMYLVFFFLQARYLFGAFTRTLPDGFTVAEYARQGFFELCRVMAINFVLFWLVTKTGTADRKTDRALNIMSILLLAESMIFAVIALSKLGLYISCFGFTPKRLESSWLACVLLCGCVCALVTHLTHRKSFRIWMIFGAATLAVLSLY